MINSVALRKLQALFLLGLIIGFLISFELYLYLIEIILYKPSNYVNEPVPAAPSRIIYPNIFIIAIIIIALAYFVIRKLRIEFISIEDISS